MIFYTCFSIAFSCKFTCMVIYLTHWEVLMKFYTRIMQTKISDRWLRYHLQRFHQMNVKFHGALLIISLIQVVGCCSQPTSHYLDQDQHPHIMWPGWNESYDELKKQVFGRIYNPYKLRPLSFYRSIYGTISLGHTVCTRPYLFTRQLHDLCMAGNAGVNGNASITIIL